MLGARPWHLLLHRLSTGMPTAYSAPYSATLVEPGCLWCPSARLFMVASQHRGRKWQPISPAYRKQQVATKHAPVQALLGGATGSGNGTRACSPFWLSLVRASMMQIGPASGRQDCRHRPEASISHSISHSASHGTCHAISHVIGQGVADTVAHSSGCKGVAGGLEWRSCHCWHSRHAGFPFRPRVRWPPSRRLLPAEAARKDMQRLPSPSQDSPRRKSTRAAKWHCDDTQCSDQMPTSSSSGSGNKRNSSNKQQCRHQAAVTGDSKTTGVAAALMKTQDGSTHKHNGPNFGGKQKAMGRKEGTSSDSDATGLEELVSQQLGSCIGAAAGTSLWQAAAVVESQQVLDASSNARSSITAPAPVKFEATNHESSTAASLPTSKLAALNRESSVVTFLATSNSAVQNDESSIDYSSSITSTHLPSLLRPSPDPGPAMVSPPSELSTCSGQGASHTSIVTPARPPQPPPFSSSTTPRSKYTPGLPRHIRTMPFLSSSVLPVMAIDGSSTAPSNCNGSFVDAPWNEGSGTPISGALDTLQQQATQPASEPPRSSMNSTDDFVDTTMNSSSTPASAVPTGDFLVTPVSSASGGDSTISPANPTPSPADPDPNSAVSSAQDTCAPSSAQSQVHSQTHALFAPEMSKAQVQVSTGEELKVSAAEQLKASPSEELEVCHGEQLKASGSEHVAPYQQLKASRAQQVQLQQSGTKAGQAGGPLPQVPRLAAHALWPSVHPVARRVASGAARPALPLESAALPPFPQQSWVYGQLQSEAFRLYHLTKDCSSFVPVFLDFETAGFSRLIVQMCFQCGLQNKPFSTIVNPGDRVNEGNLGTHIHQISMDDVRTAPRWSRAALHLLRYLGDQLALSPGIPVLVGHNVNSFDIPILVKALATVQILLPPHWMWLDTLIWSRFYYKSKHSKFDFPYPIALEAAVRPESMKLENLHSFFGCQVQGRAHSAVTDVLMVRNVYLQLLQLGGPSFAELQDLMGLKGVGFIGTVGDLTISQLSRGGKLDHLWVRMPWGNTPCEYSAHVDRELLETKTSNKKSKADTKKNIAAPQAIKPKSSQQLDPALPTITKLALDSAVALNTSKLGEPASSLDSSRDNVVKGSMTEHAEGLTSFSDEQVVAKPSTFVGESVAELPGRTSPFEVGDTAADHEADHKAGRKAGRKAAPEVHIKAGPNAEIQPDIKADHEAGILVDLKAGLDADLQPGITTDTTVDHTADLTAHLKIDLKTDLIADLKAHLNANLKADLEADLNACVKADLKADPRLQNLKASITQSLPDAAEVGSDEVLQQQVLRSQADDVTNVTADVLGFEQKSQEDEMPGWPLRDRSSGWLGRMQSQAVAESGASEQQGGRQDSDNAENACKRQEGAGSGASFQPERAGAEIAFKEQPGAGVRAGFSVAFQQQETAGTEVVFKEQEGTLAEAASKEQEGSLRWANLRQSSRSAAGFDAEGAVAALRVVGQAEDKVGEFVEEGEDEDALEQLEDDRARMDPAAFLQNAFEEEEDEPIMTDQEFMEWKCGSIDAVKPLGLRVDKCKAFTPKQVQQLQEAGFDNMLQVLMHFPRDYFAYSKELLPEDPHEAGQVVSLDGVVTRSKAGRFSKLRSYCELIIEVQTTEGKTARIKAYKVGFGGGSWGPASAMSGMSARFPPGAAVRIRGRVKQNTRLKIAEFEAQSTPMFDIALLSDLDDEVSERLVDVIYPACSPLEPKDFTGTAKREGVIPRALKALEGQPGSRDVLPEDVRQEVKLMGWMEALRAIHAPQSFEEKDAAVRRMAFQEYFMVQVSMLLQHNVFPTKSSAQSTTMSNRSLVEAARKALPFTLTTSQERVLSEVLDDMSRRRPMFRLLQGDVGSGKTIIAFLSLMAAVGSGSQGVMMAPTEVLARQHFNNLDKLLQSMPDKVRPRIALLSGGEKVRHKRQVAQDIADNNVEIVIGTNALLFTKDWPNLGLLIIDEQHRFGVRQRAKLAEKSGNSMPHILSMTATPIPRTLAMAQYGDMHLSQLTGRIPGRKAIQTTVLSDTPKHHKQVYELVLREVADGGRAYIVLPLVEESNSEAMEDVKDAISFCENLKASKALKDTNIGLLHGRMSPADKEQIVREFADGRTPVLVCTTVIEVGVDVPAASVMVVEHAERFGLATLHQLRGRVGRSSRESFCILFNSMAKENDRLKVMEISQDGHEIAQRDLALRGPGDFLGTRQHGQLHLSAPATLMLCKERQLMDKARMAAQMVVSTNSITQELKAALLAYNFFTENAAA